MKKNYLRNLLIFCLFYSFASLYSAQLTVNVDDCDANPAVGQVRVQNDTYNETITLVNGSAGFFIPTGVKNMIANDFSVSLQPNPVHEGIVFGREFIYNAADSVLINQLEIEKHWYNFGLWGKLAYNNELSDDYADNGTAELATLKALNTGNAEYQDMLLDIESMAHLGRFYADKLRCAITWYKFHMAGYDPNDPLFTQAKNEIYAAKAHWEDYAAVLDQHYIKYLKDSLLITQQNGKKSFNPKPVMSINYSKCSS